MITSDSQRDITRGEAETFRAALSDVLAKSKVETDPEERAWLDIYADAFRSQLADLEEDLAEYDRLRSRQPLVVQVQSVDELPAILIKARISSGLSEQQLATRLGVQEADISRAEASDYTDASLGFLRAVAHALGVELHGEATLPGDRAAD